MHFVFFVMSSLYYILSTKGPPDAVAGVLCQAHIYIQYINNITCITLYHQNMRKEKSDRFYFYSCCNDIVSRKTQLCFTGLDSVHIQHHISSYRCGRLAL
uniref:Putative secreted protein n=1 Tax=Ixodes ricinus TaxID=34613 RepID=A0A6B0U5Y6_IXORI